METDCVKRSRVTGSLVVLVENVVLCMFTVLLNFIVILPLRYDNATSLSPYTGMVKYMDHNCHSHTH